MKNGHLAAVGRTDSSLLAFKIYGMVFDFAAAAAFCLEQQQQKEKGEKYSARFFQTSLKKV